MCVAWMVQKRSANWVLVSKAEKKDCFEYLGINKKIILKYILKTGWVGVKSIQLAQYRDQWWVLVNNVMNLHILQNVGNFLMT
jgi:hypothetical protein